MAEKLKPARFEVHGCTPQCGLSFDKLGPDLQKTFHNWYEQGLNDIAIGQNSDKVGHHVSYGAIGRHRARHLVRIVSLGDDPLAEERDVEKVDHIEVLDRIISMGYKRLNPGKLSPEIVLKAMDMHFRYTQGRALEDTYAAIASAMAEAGGDSPSAGVDTDEANREAIKTPAELAEELAALG